MKRIIITILIILCGLIYPFSKKPKWIPEQKEYYLELTNSGDLPLEIYSLSMAVGDYTEIGSQRYTIEPDGTLTVYISASSCVDTLIIRSNSVPNNIQKVLFKYNKLKVLP